MKKLLYMLGIVLLFSSSAWATDFYISNAGSDSNNGTSTDTPFLTIHQYTDHATHGTDDKVYLKKGDIFREQVNINSTESGTAGHPVTFDAYGTGALPIVSGAKIQTGFTLDNGTVYKKVLGESHTPQGTWYNDSRITYDSTKTTTLVSGTWNYVSGTDTLWVNVGEDPTTHDLETSRRDYCFLIDATSSYIDFKNMTLSGSDAIGFSIQGSHFNFTNINANNSGPEDGDNALMTIWTHGSYVTFDGGTITNNYGRGFEIWGDHIIIRNYNISATKGTINTVDNIQILPNVTSDVLIENCTLSMVGNTTTYKGVIKIGQPPAGDTDWVIVRNCDISGGTSAQHAVNIARDRVIVENNYIHNFTSHNVRGAIFLPLETLSGSITGTNVFIRNNIIKDIYIGLHSEDDSDTTLIYDTFHFYNNTIINPEYMAIDLQDSINGDIKNNIITGTTTTNIKVRVDTSAHLATMDMDYNCYFAEQSNTFRIGASTNYATLAAWTAATGQDAHSIVTNPNLTSVWRPTSTTPNSVVLSDVLNDYNGCVRDATPTLGAIEYGWTLCQ